MKIRYKFDFKPVDLTRTSKNLTSGSDTRQWYMVYGYLNSCNMRSILVETNCVITPYCVRSIL